MATAKAVVMNAADNTATAVEAVGPEADVSMTIGGKPVTVHVVDAIAFGHKFAVRDIGKGERIVKYGETIGLATQDIAAGRHVHVHNLESGRGRGDR
jgi:altronate dehydratase small subunit